MKKLSKFMSVILTAVMVISLFTSISVSAANVFFEMDYSDVVTYSFDITVPEGKILVAQPKAPMNTASATNTNWAQGVGCVKIAEGKIQASKEWLDYNNSTITGANTDFPAGQKNNLMMRKNHRTGYTEFIANGASFCTTTMDYKTLPVTMLQVFGDGADVSTIETVFIKGTVEGELGVIADCDKDNKRITVRFTEPVDTSTDLSTTVLKKANGNKDEAETVALTVSDFDGRTAVFTYETALSPNEDYSVVLPEGLTGSLGGKIRVYPKIAVDATSLYQENNYSTGSTDIWKNDDFNPIDSGEEDHGGVMVFGAYTDTGDYDRDIYKLDIPDSNIFTISYDVKVLVDTIKMGWTLWQQKGADDRQSTVSLCYGTTDGTAAGNFMLLQTDTSNTNAGWISSDEAWQTKLGAWKKDQWINHKLEFNRTEKTVKAYVDGIYKATKTIKNSDSCSIIAPGKTGTVGTWHFSVVGASGPTTKGTHFMYMDNIKVETIAEPTVVSKAEFVDGRGNEAGAGDTISRLLDKVNVKFSAEIDESTLTASTVKLYYNSTEVGYTPSYSATTRTYTLEPTRLPDANAEVKVVVDGVYTPGDSPVAFTPFEAVVTADDTESKLFVYEVEAVDETDVRPFSGALTKNNRTSYYPIMRAANFTDNPQKITLISAEYDVDGILTSVKIENPVTVDPGSYIRYGGKLNGDNVIASNSNTKTIKVFAWDGTNMITPLCGEPAIATK